VRSRRRLARAETGARCDNAVALRHIRGRVHLHDTSRVHPVPRVPGLPSPRVVPGLGPGDLLEEHGPRRVRGLRPSSPDHAARTDPLRGDQPVSRRSPVPLRHSGGRRGRRQLSVVRHTTGVPLRYLPRRSEVAARTRTPLVRAGRSARHCPHHIGTVGRPAPMGHPPGPADVGAQRSSAVVARSHAQRDPGQAAAQRAGVRPNRSARPWVRAGQTTGSCPGISG
jgi:hypothetical protein